MSQGSNANEDSTSPGCLSSWRRPLRKLHSVPVGLPHHRKEKLHLTTSKGQFYLLDQFRDKVPLPVRNYVIAMLSEFVGTFMFMVRSCVRKLESESELLLPPKYLTLPSLPY